MGSWHGCAMADSPFLEHARSLSQRACVVLNENSVVERKYELKWCLICSNHIQMHTLFAVDPQGRFRNSSVRELNERIMRTIAISAKPKY